MPEHTLMLAHRLDPLLDRQKYFNFTFHVVNGTPYVICRHMSFSFLPFI